MVTQKLQFSGALFDGKSAQKHLVHIELTPREIILTVQDCSAVNWPYSTIQWAAETTTAGPYQIEHQISESEGKRIETLVIEDPEFYENCLRISPEEFSGTVKKNSFNWKIFIGGTLILLLFLYGAFRVVPHFLVDQFVDKIPAGWEEALGEVILTAFPVEKDPDPQVLTLLQNILRLLMQSMPEETPYKLKIYILPTKQINALALPGGGIIVFEGLLKVADSPEELAGVLAHEAQHVFLRHSTKGVLRNLASGMLLALVLGDANAVMEGVVNIAGQLNSLGLSRSMETEADRKGMELMLAAKINPQGMLSIFKKILEEELRLTEKRRENSPSENKETIFSYLSTHPSGQDRLKKLTNQFEKNSKQSWIPLYPNSNWNEIKPQN